MKIQRKHPDRTQLIKSIKSPDMSILKHLEECESCRTIYQLLKVTSISYLEFEPTEELISRCANIPIVVKSREVSNISYGRVSFDSWNDLPALAVRQASFGIERRIRFNYIDYTFDFIATKQSDGWNFVGRIYKGDAVSSEFVLQSGNRKVALGAGNCFNWTSSRPVKRMKLLSEKLVIDLGSLKW